MRIRERFNPRAPCGARPHRRGGMAGEKVISTHAPLAGRDASVIVDRKPSVLFQPTRPLRGATRVQRIITAQTKISTHAPLAGRDLLRLLI